MVHLFLNNRCVFTEKPPPRKDFGSNRPAIKIKTKFILKKGCRDDVRLKSIALQLCTDLDQSSDNHVYITTIFNIY